MDIKKEYENHSPKLYGLNGLKLMFSRISHTSHASLTLTKILLNTPNPRSSTFISSHIRDLDLGNRIVWLEGGVLGGFQA